jgi:hypothetical protein
MPFNWKVSVQRFLIIGSLAMLCALSISVGTAKPASAATSCYGGAVSFSTTVWDTTLGPYYTTSRCNDINLRFSNLPHDVAVDVCWTNYNYCRSTYYGYTTIYAGNTSWHVIAFDVADGTKFTVKLISLSGNSFNAAGYIAF